MNPPPSLLTREQFAEWVQDALNRLYDSPYLQKHVLGDLFQRGGIHTIQPSHLVRKVLMDAIEELRPRANVPAQSPDWRAYRILELRYIEGLPTLETMNRLALARSQYFREQGRALESLISILWERWQPVLTAENMPALDSELAERTEMVQREVDRLSAQGKWEHLDIFHFLNDLKPMLIRLAEDRGCTINFETPSDPILINADRIILRQVILTAISLAIELFEGRSISVHAQSSEHEIEIFLLVDTDVRLSSIATLTERLSMCEKLMAAMDGKLTAQELELGGVGLSFVWSALVPQVVLVIDDNEGIAELFRRYLATQNWQVRGASGAAEARLAIAHALPTLIVLDVLMPQEDGWELLMSLKQDERTQSIPTVICSVLQDPQLALTLGADAYLSKPVSQQALLELMATLSRT